MSALQELYAAVSARITGDTGSGGLANNSGDQYVPVVERWDTERQDLPQKPAILIRVSSRERFRSMGETGRMLQVDFIIVTDGDQDETKQDAVHERLIELLGDISGWTPTGTDWSFSPLSALGESSGQITDLSKNRPLTVSYWCAGFRGATPALMGSDVTLTNYSGGKCFYVSRVTSRQEYNVTTMDEGEGNRSFALGDKTESGVMRFYVTGAPPTDGLKSGVIIALSGAVSLTGDIQISKTNLVAAVGSAQIYDARYVVNGELA